jgi:geranylgeranyl pyrophosphate synthase
MTDSILLAERWDHWRQRVDDCLEYHLPSAETEPATLHRAMRYAVIGAGKRFRAALVYGTGEGLGANSNDLDLPACAVELVHAFSLVHDDLPAMDDDDLRRGKPSCHVAFGQATAILTGDALQSLAFDLLASDSSRNSTHTRLAMVQILAQATGGSGMAGGQAIDLSAAGKASSKTALETMHRMKTGALIAAAIQMGAQAAGAKDPTLLEDLNRYGLVLGLTFQITDDILDETTETAELGKMQGSDRKQDKPTFFTVLGETSARQAAIQYHREAREILARLPMDVTALVALTDFVTSRHH